MESESTAVARRYGVHKLQLVESVYYCSLLCVYENGHIEYISVLKSVFYSRSDAVSNVYISFDNYVTT